MGCVLSLTRGWAPHAGNRPKACVTFVYRFASEDAPPIKMKLKVEINSREHFAVHGFRRVPFSVASRWFEGSCELPTFELDELLGTKLRALYQRKKGRDLFDLAVALAQDGVDPARVVETFAAYMDHDGHSVTRALFKQNMHQKRTDPQFTVDIGPLLASGYSWDFIAAAVRPKLDKGHQSALEAKQTYAPWG
jgi:predicted nucleotidyltransferase component of viral defense system